MMKIIQQIKIYVCGRCWGGGGWSQAFNQLLCLCHLGVWRVPVSILFYYQSAVTGGGGLTRPAWVIGGFTSPSWFLSADINLCGVCDPTQLLWAPFLSPPFQLCNQDTVGSIELHPISSLFLLFIDSGTWQAVGLEWAERKPQTLTRRTSRWHFRCAGEEHNGEPWRRLITLVITLLR